MERRRLRYSLAAADELGFRRLAEVIGGGQPVTQSSTERKADCVWRSATTPRHRHSRRYWLAMRDKNAN